MSRPIVSYEVIDGATGATLVIDRGSDEHGDTYADQIPLAAIASWSELLGYGDAAETVAAILTYLDGDATDTLNPVTGENVWTEPYLVLRHLEQVREDAAQQALEEGTGDDPRSPHLRSAIAVSQAMEQISGGAGASRCIRRACQGRARAALGAPDPTVAPIVLSRQGGLTCQGDPDLTTALAPHLGEIDRRRRAFTHSLTTLDDDPLASTYPQIPDGETEQAQAARLPTLEDIITRHQGGPGGS